MICPLIFWNRAAGFQGSMVETDDELLERSQALVANTSREGRTLESSTAIANLGQSSFLSEKALFRMDIQLIMTVEVQPIRPTKNMTSKTSFAQISFKPMASPDTHRPQRL